MQESFDRTTLDLAMKSLAIRLSENNTEKIEIVVCGGSALVLTGMVPRTTKDVDIVALIRAGRLVSPAPLPNELESACRWCMTHDVSEGFRMVLSHLLKELGYEDVAKRL